MYMKITHKQDGSIKINIYRNHHTGISIYYGYQHTSTIHKLSVFRTLYNWVTIITEPQDREEEKDHIKGSLMNCHYASWAIEKGRIQIKMKEIQRDGQKKDHIKTPKTLADNSSKTTCHVNTDTVHPKDKIQPEEKCGHI